MESTAQQHSKNNKSNMKKNRAKPYDKENNDINKNIDCNKRMFLSPYAPTVTRLLARRFALTGPKYLEIGINIKDNTSHIEIALSEIFKKEIILNLKDWNQIMKYKSLIVEYIESTTITETPPLKINKRTKIDLEKYKNIKLISFTQENNTVKIAGKTFLYLINLDQCVKSHFETLQSLTGTIDEKIEIFKNISNNFKSIMDIAQHDSYNKSSVVDSELLAVYLSKK